MTKKFKRVFPIVFALVLLTISYSHVVHQGDHASKKTIIKIEQLKDKASDLTDVKLVKRILKFAAHLLPNI